VRPVVLVFAFILTCATGLRPLPGFAQTPSATEDSSGSLRVTIHPLRPWERSDTPLARDPVQTEPVSATVFDETAIRDARIDDVVDIANATPGMQMSGVTSRIVLRGAGDLLLFSTAQPPVGLYIDDVYVPNPAAFNFDLFDAGRIEVLRGPQGFTGGRGSIAGDIRIETVGPKPADSGEVAATAGSFDERRLRAVGNVATRDGRAANRLALSFLRRDGTIDNLSTGEPVDTRRNWGARDQMKMAIEPGLSADFSVDYADYSPVRPAPGLFASVLGGTVSIFRPPTERKKLYGASMRVRRTGGALDLTSITAARGLKYDSFGSDYGPYNLLNQRLNQSELRISQELRLSTPPGRSVDWTAGAFFYGQKQDQESGLQFNNAAPALMLPYGHAETSLADQRLWSTAAFGEATWHVDDRLDLIAGLRAGYDRSELDYRYVSNNGFALLAPIQTREEAANFNGLSWRAGVSYTLAPGVAPYALVSHAHKPGGFNTVQLPAGAVGFAKEAATSYEVGLKSSWFGGALVANAAAFHVERSDQQVQNVAVFGAPTVNADESRARGVELSLAGRPAPGLDLMFGYAYTDSEFTDFADYPGPASTTLDLSGRALPFVSRHSLSAALAYVRPLGEAIRFVFRTDVSYRSHFYFDPRNTLRQPGYGLWNMRVGIEGDRWGLYAWGKNLTDTGYRTSASTDATATALATAGDPRTLGLEVRLRF